MKHMLKDSTVLKEDLDRLVFSENINFDKDPVFFLRH